MENPQFVHTAKALIKWLGSDGQLVSYEPTRQTATVALWFSLCSERGYLQLSLGGCSRLDLPTTWSNGRLMITDLEQTKQFKIEDLTHGIVVICSEASATPRKEQFWCQPE